MTSRTLVFLLFLVTSVQVVILGISKIKLDQTKLKVKISAVEYREFQHQIEILLGKGTLEQLKTTDCTQDLWRAYQGEQWESEYCEHLFTYILINMGKRNEPKNNPVNPSLSIRL